MITKCLRSRMKERRVQHQAREKGVEEGTDASSCTQSEVDVELTRNDLNHSVFTLTATVT